MVRKVQIGKFKAECLHLLAEVNRTKVPLIITKHHVPLVKILPIQEPQVKKMFGSMEGTIEFLDDIIAPLDESWDADRQ